MLAEKVGFGLFAEGGLDHARARAADPLRVGEHEVAGVAGCVLVDGSEPGNALPLLELATNEVPWPFGSDHADVDLARRLDLAEVDRETVREEQQVAGGDAVFDLALPGLGLVLVRDQDHHHVAGAGGVGDVENAQTLALGFGARRRAWPQADDNVDAGVAQVQRVRVALRPVADDRDGLTFELAEIGVLVVDHRPALYPSRSAKSRAARASSPRSSLPRAVRGKASAKKMRFGTL
ncbi:hypothetical protein HRbin41_00830 [bacterium HR41]|nr:hypothetical protein HRbin41_00830 [bacterium HR41]